MMALSLLVAGAGLSLTACSSGGEIIEDEPPLPQPEQTEPKDDPQENPQEDPQVSDDQQ